MPLLDVSDILDDPDFMDTITVKRTVVTVDGFGRSTSSTTTQPVQAVITSADGQNLLRAADGRMAIGGITVHTRFPLSSGDGVIEPDIIIWHGKQYTIDIVNDYTGYGQGFVSASALIRSVT